MRFKPCKNNSPVYTVYTLHSQQFVDTTATVSQGLSYNKLTPWGTDGQLITTDISAKSSSKSRDIKTRTNIKNPTTKSRYCALIYNLTTFLRGRIVNALGRNVHCAVERDALSDRGQIGQGASAYQKIIYNNSYVHDEQGDNPGQEKGARRCPL